jgi:hypothetical protein
VWKEKSPFEGQHFPAFSESQRVEHRGSQESRISASVSQSEAFPVSEMRSNERLHPRNQSAADRLKVSKTFRRQPEQQKQQEEKSPAQ